MREGLSMYMGIDTHAIDTYGRLYVLLFPKGRL